MKNKLKTITQWMLILVFIIFIVFFLQCTCISDRVKMAGIDILLLSICVKYRRFRKPVDKKSILFTIQWYGLFGMIVLLTLGIVLYGQ